MKLISCSSNSNEVYTDQVACRVVTEWWPLKSVSCCCGCDREWWGKMQRRQTSPSSKYLKSSTGLLGTSNLQQVEPNNLSLNLRRHSRLHWIVCFEINCWHYLLCPDTSEIASFEQLRSGRCSNLLYWHPRSCLFHSQLAHILSLFSVICSHGKSVWKWSCVP